jgi:hypothetical protein
MPKATCGHPERWTHAELSIAIDRHYPAGLEVLRVRLSDGARVEVVIDRASRWVGWLVPPASAA